MFKRIVLDVLKVFLGFGVVYFHGVHFMFAPPQTPYEGFITHALLAITLLAGLVLGIEGLRDLIKAFKD